MANEYGLILSTNKVVFITGNAIFTFFLSLSVLLGVTACAETDSLSMTNKMAVEEGRTEDYPAKVGEEVIETYETLHPYYGAGVVWEHKFYWKNASYISIHFSGFDLAPGDYVEIGSPDGKYQYRYEGKGKVVRGGEAVLSIFWASHIPGDTAIIKLNSAGNGKAWGFLIDKWTHGFSIR